MGVTYKLKDDIVQFILRQKQENPNISCRKLVEIIQESFKISVSKSSVNIIIKDAHLSNPVGRTPLQGIKPKFKIPPEKKTELFEKAKPTLEGMGVKNAGAVESVPIPVKIENTPSSPLPETIKLPDSKEETLRLKAALEAILFVAPAESGNAAITPPPPPVSVYPGPEVIPGQEVDAAKMDEEKEKISLRPDPVAQSQPEIRSQETVREILKPEETKEPEGFDVPQIGDIFLRMSLWDLFRSPSMEAFLKHHTDLSNEDIKILDTLLSFSGDVFAHPSEALDDKRAWMWRLSGFSSPPPVERLDQLMKKLGETQIPSFDFYLDASYFFTFAYEARIILNDQSVVRLDPRLTLFDQSRTFSCPMDSSVERISKFMSDRDNEAVLFCPSLSDMFEDFKNFIAACEARDLKKIEKILLYNAAGQELSEFSSLSVFKRKFIVASRISRAELKELLSVEVFFTADNAVIQDGQSLFWAEHASQLSGFENVRIIVFSSSVDGEGLLSVLFLSQSSAAPQALAATVVDMQVYDNRHFIDCETLFSMDESAPHTTLSEAFRIIKDKIDEYCSKIVKNAQISAELFANISKSSGYVTINTKLLIIKVKTSETDTKPLHKIFNQLNSYKISDYDRNSVVISI